MNGPVFDDVSSEISGVHVPLLNHPFKVVHFEFHEAPSSLFSAETVSSDVLTLLQVITLKRELSFIASS
jgi:hypothetical protein